MRSHPGERLLITPEELRHLDEGPRAGELAGGVGLVEIVASTSGEADHILRRCREVLRVVLLTSVNGWPAEYVWREILPRWFVEGCAPEESPEEEAQWLLWWRGLTGEERSHAVQERAWSLPDWLHWLDPDKRQWYWWEGVARGEHEVRIFVEVPGWPAAIGALEWLLRAAGAGSVDVADELIK